MKAAQTGLSIQQGPIFRTDVFDLAGQDQLVIFMVAHHLCVDMVSWRIIVQDLGELLEKRPLTAEMPLSFRSWCALQAEDAKTADTKALLPFKETPPHMGYWGVNRRLTYSTTETEAFTLAEDMTKLALTDCHKAFRSEPMDLFLAAVAHAFARTFSDRELPTLHTETHGREAPAGSLVDLSRTVGWFTSICPLRIPIRTGDVTDAVRRTKDMRRTIPSNGRPYFAHKCLSGATDVGSSPMEVLFNYLGGGVSGEDDDALDAFRQVPDVGPDTTRLALFEISAVVINNKLHFSFIYDTNLSRVDDVRRWIADCKDVLEEMIRGLMQRPAQPTLSDYPLLPLTYDNLHTLTSVTLARLGIENDLACIEDIYPCTPVQEGMLISQLRDPNAYIFHAVYSVQHPDPNFRLNVDRLVQSWRKVVNRHPTLRTVFIESVHRDGVFDQLVLKEPHCEVTIIKCSDDEAMERLNEAILDTTKNPHSTKQPRLPHQLTVCATHGGQVLIKFETNHAALDGGSLPILLYELAAAYEGTLDPAPGPLYSDYIRYIRSHPAREGTEYWMNHLKGLKPCYFPKLNTSADAERSLHLTRLKFDRYKELRQLSEQTHVTLANIMHAAWALVLRKYTGVDDVCFGYLTAGRDAPVENIERTVGTLINMLCCRLDISKAQALADIFRTAQNEYLQSIPFQQSSLARVQHDLGLAGKTLYNTSISTQNHAGRMALLEESGGISFELEAGHDPSEVSSLTYVPLLIKSFTDKQPQSTPSLPTSTFRRAPKVSYSATGPITSATSRQRRSPVPWPKPWKAFSTNPHSQLPNSTKKWA